MNAAKATVVPVVLGCCPDHPRCMWCPPPAPMPAEKVEALVHHYRTERTPTGGSLVVRFFGGAPPSAEQIEAIGGLPFGVRVRPDLLTRAESTRLAAAGCIEVELDALTFDTERLRRFGRRYGRRILTEQSEQLGTYGLAVGGVLAPGIPGSTHASCIEDATLARQWWSFARIHPIQVLAHSGLRERHAIGRYTALELGETITICREMMDVLEPDVTIRRVGMQAGPDGFGRAVAGPRHSGLRQLVEARRTLDHLRTAMVGHTGAVRVRCAPADETRTRGPLNQHIRTLRAELGLREVVVQPDVSVARGQFVIEAIADS